MTIHELKCWPEYFASILSGDKTSETRRNDRDPPFTVGDVLYLREFIIRENVYSGRSIRVRVLSVTDLDEFGAPGFVSMRIETA